jgi:hypothetical protein
MQFKQSSTSRNTTISALWTVSSHRIELKSDDTDIRHAAWPSVCRPTLGPVHVWGGGRDTVEARRDEDKAQWDSVGPWRRLPAGLARAGRRGPWGELKPCQGGAVWAGHPNLSSASRAALNVTFDVCVVCALGCEVRGDQRGYLHVIMIVPRVTCSVGD